MYLCRLDVSVVQYLSGRIFQHRPYQTKAAAGERCVFYLRLAVETLNRCIWAERAELFNKEEIRLTISQLPNRLYQGVQTYRVSYPGPGVKMQNITV